MVAKSSYQVCSMENYGHFFRKSANVHNWPKKVLIFMNVSVREMANIELFKKQVKTILFTNADGFKRKAFCYNV